MWVKPGDVPEWPKGTVCKTVQPGVRIPSSPRSNHPYSQKHPGWNIRMWKPGHNGQNMTNLGLWRSW